MNDHLSESSNGINNKDFNKLNNNATNGSNKRYRTRSSVLSQNGLNHQDQEPKSKQRETTAKPAFIEYKGKVEYFTEFFDIAFASDNLL